MKWFESFETINDYPKADQLEELSTAVANMYDKTSDGLNEFEEALNDAIKTAMVGGYTVWVGFHNLDYELATRVNSEVKLTTKGKELIGLFNKLRFKTTYDLEPCLDPMTGDPHESLVVMLEW